MLGKHCIPFLELVETTVQVLTGSVKEQAHFSGFFRRFNGIALHPDLILRLPEVVATNRLPAAVDSRVANHLVWSTEELAEMKLYVDGAQSFETTKDNILALDGRIVTEKGLSDAKWRCKK